MKLLKSAIGVISMLAIMNVWADGSMTLVIHNKLAEPVTYTNMLDIPDMPPSGTVEPGEETSLNMPYLGIGFGLSYDFETAKKSTIAKAFAYTTSGSSPQCDNTTLSMSKVAGKSDILANIDANASCKNTSSNSITINATLSYNNPPKVKIQIKNVNRHSGDDQTLTLLSADPAVASDYYLTGDKPNNTIQPGDLAQGVFSPAPNGNSIRPYADDATLEYGYDGSGGTSACIIKYHVTPISTGDKKPVCSITTEAINDNPNRHISCGSSAAGYDLSNNQCNALAYVEFGDETAQTTHVSMANASEGIPAGQDSSISLTGYTPKPGQSIDNFYRNTDQGPAAEPQLAADGQISYDYIQKNLTDATMTYAYTVDHRLACSFIYGREDDQCAAEATPSEYIGTVRSLVCSAEAIPQADGSCKADFGMKFGDYRDRDVVVNATNTATNELNQPVDLMRTELTPSSDDYPTPPPTDIKGDKTVNFDYQLKNQPQQGGVIYTYQQGDNSSACKISYNWTFSPFSQNLGCSVSTQVINQGDPGVRLACNATPVTLDGQVCRANVSITTGEKLPPANYQVNVKNLSGMPAELQNAVPATDSGDYATPPPVSIEDNGETTFTLHAPKTSPTPGQPASVNYGYTGMNQSCEFEYSWDPSKLCGLAVKWVKNTDNATQAPLASGLHCSPCNSQVKYDPNTRTCYVGFAISLNRNCEMS